MSDNQGNPLQGSETDVQKAQKAINGLLEPKKETKAQEPEEIKQNSPEPQNEESENDQPQEQEIMEEETTAESQDETEEETSEDVSQDEEQIDTQEKLEDSTYKVKVAGQELEVTLDELRNGYSRDADYRQKTEELSNQRKSFQSEVKHFLQQNSQQTNYHNR